MKSSSSPDPRALAILKATYRRDPYTRPSDEDFAYAKAQGVMFEPKKLDHDAAVDWVIAARKKVKAKDAADAFVASLTTRRFDWRTAFAAFVVARHLPKHKREGDPCSVCYWEKRDGGLVDLSDLNYRRIVIGSIWMAKLPMLAFTLERFAGEAKPRPTRRDEELLDAIFDCVRTVQQSLGADGRAHRAEVEKGIAKIIDSGKYERMHLLDALGYAGVLAAPSSPGFRTGWVRYDQRRGTDGEWDYPFGNWRAIHGIDVAAQREWFPRSHAVEVATPTIRKGVPAELKSLHPLVGAALSAIPEGRRPPAGKFHAGGPAPEVPIETLIELATGWIRPIRKLVPPLYGEIFGQLEEAIAARKDPMKIAWHAKQVKDPAVAGAALVLNSFDARGAHHQLRALAGAAKKMAVLDPDFPEKLDDQLMRAELGRSVEKILFRAPGVTLARLKKGQLGLLVGDAWTTGKRDDVLACVPDEWFQKATSAAISD